VLTAAVVAAPHRGRSWLIAAVIAPRRVLNAPRASAKQPLVPVSDRCPGCPFPMVPAPVAHRLRASKFRISLYHARRL